MAMAFDMDDEGVDSVGAAGAGRRPGGWGSALRGDVAVWVLAGVVFLLPLYRTAILEDSFNTPKLALLLVLEVVAALGVLARRGDGAVWARGAGRWGRFGALWLVMAFAGWQGLSVLWAGSKPLGVDGMVYFATGAVLCWLFVRGVRGVEGLELLMGAGAAAAVVTAVWVLGDDFGRGLGALVARLPDWRGHLAAGLGNSGHIAGMVGMFFPWVLMGFVGGRGGRSWWLLGAVGLMVAALAVTWSVGSCGATIVSTGVWGGVAWWRWWGRGRLSGRRMAAVVAVALGVCGFYFTENGLNPHRPNLWREAFSSQRWEEGWPTRVAIWETAWHMIRGNPVLGVGAGNFTFAYVQQVVPGLAADPALRVYAGSFTNDAHNDYVQTWAEVGVVGLGLWLGVLGLFYRGVWGLLGRRGGGDWRVERLALGAGAGFTVFALDGLMSFPMFLPAHLAMAMFFVAVPGVLLEVAGRRGAGARSEAGGDGGDDGVGRAVAGPGRKAVGAGGAGVLLILAACCWHHGHRVVAEYFLKAGRTAADGGLVVMERRPVPAWRAAEGVYQQVLGAVAMGAPAETVRMLAGQMHELAQGPALDEAEGLFRRALGADRWYANAASRLGFLELMRGNYEESMRVNRRALKTLEAYEIHERLGLAAYLAGNMRVARDEWMTCMMRRPATADFYRALVERTR